MAKGNGLIGNFRGKLGNAVGYSLKDSNNNQTQGIRIYQPIVKNPKTYAQAEQRAKLAPINATYRVLKPIIDRGQEGIAYGSKSRLAWLKSALKADTGVYFNKGANITYPWVCAISSGTLPVIPLVQDSEDSKAHIRVTGLTAEDNTIAKLSGRLIKAFPGLQYGDQITFVMVRNLRDTMYANVVSIILDELNEEGLPSDFSLQADNLLYGNGDAPAVIVSRLGDNGQHLRSGAVLTVCSTRMNNNTDPSVKKEAVRSYMGATQSSDWPEEPID